MQAATAAAYDALSLIRLRTDVPSVGWYAEDDCWIPHTDEQNNWLSLYRFVRRGWPGTEWHAFAQGKTAEQRRVWRALRRSALACASISQWYYTVLSGMAVWNLDAVQEVVDLAVMELLPQGHFNGVGYDFMMWTPHYGGELGSVPIGQRAVLRLQRWHRKRVAARYAHKQPMFFNMAAQDAPDDSAPHIGTMWDYGEHINWSDLPTPRSNATGAQELPEVPPFPDWGCDTVAQEAEAQIGKKRQRSRRHRKSKPAMELVQQRPPGR